MILNVENTAGPAVRAMAQVKNFFEVFSVFKSKVWDWATSFIFGAKFLVQFGWFLVDLVVFWGLFGGSQNLFFFNILQFLKVTVKGILGCFVEFLLKFLVDPFQVFIFRNSVHRFPQSE